MADRKLARSIVLTDGAILATIGDAAALLEKLSKGRTRDILKCLFITLLKAAESGSRKDLGSVTEQLEHVLYYAGLLRTSNEA